MEHELSLEARIFLAKLYRTYLFRRERGISKAAARVFNHLAEDYRLEMSAEALYSACEELAQAGLMYVSFHDLLPDCAALHRPTITHLEKTAGRTIADVIRHLLFLCEQQHTQLPKQENKPSPVRIIPFDEEAFYTCLGKKE